MPKDLQLRTGTNETLSSQSPDTMNTPLPSVPLPQPQVDLESQMRGLLRARLECNATMMTQPLTLTGLYCPRTWDTMMCWSDAAAGTVVHRPCPAYVHGFDPAKNATKRCLDNGTWYTSAVTGRPWTNFSACHWTNFSASQKEEGLSPSAIPELLVEHLPGIKLMSTIGYTLSLAALILAVTIMICFRRLHCQRNLIHLNMFLAFLGRAACSLLMNVLLVKNVGFPSDVIDTGDGIEFIQQGSHWECKLFFTLFYYIIFCSVMWLFNEGLFLVIILSVSVFAEKTNFALFLFLGWGLPLVFMVPWIVCRIVFDDILCWQVHNKKNIFWILRGPMVASVTINFFFFLHIVRLLFTKLTASHCPQSRTVRYRKLAKSTLVLIPLFAVYHVGFVWLPDDLSPQLQVFTLWVEMLFNSFHGLLVAFLFCFLNAEVQNEIREKWRKQVLRGTGRWRPHPLLRPRGFHTATRGGGDGGGGTLAKDPAVNVSNSVGVLAPHSSPAGVDSSPQAPSPVNGETTEAYHERSTGLNQETVEL